MRVVVVGGGISGVAAAKAALLLGSEVTILEASSSLGGLMAKIANCRVGFKTFFDEIRNHPGLEVITGATIEWASERGGLFEILLEDGSSISASSIVVASGAQPYEPQRKGKRVMTSLEYDRLIDQETERLPEGLRRIAFVLCVGSRSREYPLCSSVCCSYTLRQIRWTLQRAKPEVTVFYNDLRLSGQEFSLEKALREAGVRFLRTSSRNFEETEEGVWVTYYVGGRIRQERFDSIVLSCALRPSPSLRRLSEIFGFSLNEFGFVKEQQPLVTTRKGIFACGCALEPMTIKDSIMTGLGAGLLASGRNGDWGAYIYREDRPRLEIDGDAESYIFFLGTDDPFLAYFYEYLSCSLIELARRMRGMGKEVLFITRNVVTPSYSELSYERARRDGVIFIHLEEGEEVRLEKDGIRAGSRYFRAERLVTLEELSASLRGRQFLSLFRSEPQLRFSPTRWNRGRYHVGFVRYPREERWEGRELLCASCEAAMDRVSKKTLPMIDVSRCSGCGSCEAACPAEAIRVSFEEAPIPVFGLEATLRSPLARLKEDSCLGCGLCASLCPSHAIDNDAYKGC